MTLLKNKKEFTELLKIVKTFQLTKIARSRSLTDWATKSYLNDTFIVFGCRQLLHVDGLIVGAYSHRKYGYRFIGELRRNHVLMTKGINSG